MWSSAASALLVLASSGNQVGRLRPQEQAAWRRLSPSIAVVMQGDQPIAAAALIDDSGLFVAAKGAVSGRVVEARLASGRTVKMSVITREGATGMVLLQAQNWEPNGAVALRAPSGDGPVGSTILAVLGTGPIRAEFVTGRMHGVLPKSKRLIPMAEIRFEAPAELIGSALILSEDGEIVGALNATLKRQDDSQSSNSIIQSFGAGIGGNGGGGFGGAQLNPRLSRVPDRFGPGELTVAYTVGSSVVRRVIEGFRSPDHVVSYASLGIFCIDNPGGGVVLQSVKPESPAAKADIRPGDVLNDIGGSTIRNQIDFSKTMLRLQPGAKVTLRLSRNGMVLLKDVVLGRVVPSED